MTDDSTVLERACEYGRRGMHVFPVHADTKEPLPRYAWATLATNKINQIVEDFTSADQFWNGHVAVAWAIGLDDHVAIDWDRDPPNWAGEIESSAVVSGTVRGEHWIYRQPDGVVSGNGTANFPTTGWGEVRGRGGYVVVAGPGRTGLALDDIDKTVPFPKPEWLLEYGGGAQAVDRAEIRKFIEATQHNDKNRAKLDALVGHLVDYDTTLSGTESGRHPTWTWALTQMAEEALRGYYPFGEAMHAARVEWDRVKPNHRREFSGIVAWAIGRAYSNVGDAAPDIAEELGLETRSRYTQTILDGIVDTAGLGAIKQPEPVLDGLLYRDSLAWLIGVSGAGKTFVGIDLALTIGSGQRNWHGIDCIAGKVLYVVAEGASGARLRTEAWCDDRGIDMDDQIDVNWYPSAVNIYDPQWAEALCEVVEHLQPDLIVLDTLARSMAGGDENATSDAAVVVEHLDRIRVAAGGACVLMIHHLGKDASVGGRGSSAFKAALESELLLTGSVRSEIKLRSDKQKNVADGTEITLRPKVVELIDGSSSLVLRGDSVQTEQISEPAENQRRTAESELYEAAVAIQQAWRRRRDHKHTAWRKSYWLRDRTRGHRRSVLNEAFNMMIDKRLIYPVDDVYMVDRSADPSSHQKATTYFRLDEAWYEEVIHREMFITE